MSVSNAGGIRRGPFVEVAIGLIVTVLAVANLALPIAFWRGGSTLDASYKLLVYESIEHHLSFGRQFLETWGPLGFSDFPFFYDRVLLGVGLGLQFLSIGLLGYMTFRVTKHWIDVGPVLRVTLILLLLAAGGPALASAGWRFLILAVLVPLDDYMLGGNELFLGNSRRTAAVAGCLVALAATTEASYAATAALVVVVISVVNLLRRRFLSVAVYLLTILVTYLAIFIAFGGGVSAAVLWPIWEARNISGYSEAMGYVTTLVGSDYYVAAFAFIAISILLFLVTARASYRLIPAALLMIAIEAEGWKEGFVRDAHAPFFFGAEVWVLVILGIFSSRLGPLRVRGSGDVRAGLALEGSPR